MSVAQLKGQGLAQNGGRAGSKNGARAQLGTAKGTAPYVRGYPAIAMTMQQGSQPYVPTGATTGYFSGQFPGPAVSSYPYDLTVSVGWTGFGTLSGTLCSMSYLGSMITGAALSALTGGTFPAAEYAQSGGTFILIQTISSPYALWQNWGFYNGGLGYVQSSNATIAALRGYIVDSGGNIAEVLTASGQFDSIEHLFLAGSAHNGFVPFKLRMEIDTYNYSKSGFPSGLSVAAGFEAQRYLR
jgi:hypothetical protein